MPKIKIERVISCSSEDPDHVANNLLNSETKKKWKCLSVGEATVSVIFQLEKSSKISGIDIGNENSSFIEVLVGRSSSQEQDYKILLAASSFMTPMEARNLSNSNRVRMFTYENLVSTVRDEKWDRIKVVCTQPFNKHVQYGLSFITLHAPQEQKTTQESSTSLGKFTLRPESPDILSAGSLFAKRKELVEETKPENSLTVAQAIKYQDKPKKCKTPKVQTPSNKTSTNAEKEQRNRNRKALFYNSDEEEPNEKIDKVVEKLKIESEKKKPKTPDKPPAKKKTENKTDSPKPSSSTKKDDKTESPKKRKNNATPKVTNKKIKLVRKPFQELLKDVVFTISGIVNPERATLRTQALCMGAKYKPDWDNSCTHLICAFANTPKFNQVRGKGKIVTKSWITDCYDQRKRLPWRRYALDRNDQGKPESEDEIEEETDEPEEENPVQEIDLTETYQKQVPNVNKNLSGSDTDDEIEKILAKHKNDQDQIEDEKEEEILTSHELTVSNGKEEKSKKKKEINDDLNGNDTEEEELKKNPAEIEDIPRLFQSEIFYVDNALEDEEKNKLQRLIKSFDGVVLTSLRNIVDFVITNEDSVELIKESCSNAKCVSSNWIYECHDVLKRVPYEKFVLN